MSRLLLALRVMRWVLEVVRLAVVSAQTVLDAVILVLDGKPREPDETV